jgi:hypothetical protein
VPPLRWPAHVSQSTGQKIWFAYFQPLAKRTVGRNLRIAWAAVRGRGIYAWLVIQFIGVECRSYVHSLLNTKAAREWSIIDRLQFLSSIQTSIKLSRLGIGPDQYSRIGSVVRNGRILQELMGDLILMLNGAKSFFMFSPLIAKVAHTKKRNCLAYLFMWFSSLTNKIFT